MSEQSFGQHYANLLVVGQFAHLLFVQILFYAEVAQHLCCIAFGLPTVHFGKLVFQFGCTITVFFAHLRLRIESLALFHIVPKRLMSHQDCIENAVLIVLEMVLIQYREPFTRSQFDSSFIRFQFAADGFEQRWFTCSVGSDYAIDIAVSKFDVDVFVKNSLPELNCKIRNCYHSLYIL